MHSFDENKFTLGVFIGLSKAFDTVNHEILITKLENYGVRGSNIKWYSNYLEGKKQFICFDEKNTELENITCGVPQSSILGPLLFLIYINDIYKSSDILNFPRRYIIERGVTYTYSLSVNTSVLKFLLCK